ncbi:MAG: hypothetical protein R3B70_39425 [Polyangiaceae bacterium]
MSSGKHATVSAWQRDHDGVYTAELNGFQLKVVWVPEESEEGRGFRWEAVGPDGARTAPRETFEEIELAMAEAEKATEPKEDDAGSEAA